MRIILTSMTFVLCVLTTLKQLAITLLISSSALFLWPINRQFCWNIILTLFIAVIALSLTEALYSNTVKQFIDALPINNNSQELDKEQSKT